MCQHVIIIRKRKSCTYRVICLIRVCRKAHHIFLLKNFYACLEPWRSHNSKTLYLMLNVKSLFSNNLWCGVKHVSHTEYMLMLNVKIIFLNQLWHRITRRKSNFDGSCIHHMFSPQKQNPWWMNEIKFWIGFENEIDKRVLFKMIIKMIT